MQVRQRCHGIKQIVTLEVFNDDAPCGRLKCDFGGENQRMRRERRKAEKRRDGKEFGNTTHTSGILIMGCR